MLLFFAVISIMSLQKKYPEY